MALWEEGLRARLEVQDTAFRKALARLDGLAKKHGLELMVDTAKRFAGYARNHMPPNLGKPKISKEAAYRPVRDLSNPKSWAGVHGKMNRWARFGPEKFMFLVPFRRPDRHGVKYFHTKAEAERWSAIPNRGAARYGWAQGAKALGAARVPAVTPAGFPFAKNRDKLMGLAGKTRVERHENPAVEIENHSTAAGLPHLLRSEISGKRQAAAGLNRAIRKIEKELEKAWG